VDRPGAKAQLRVVHGDITRLEVDAIVNAANPALRGGGGVDGAIHRAAGPALLAACLKLGGCATGEARITPGFALKARHVIHAVGPVWQDGRRGEPELLASCYRRALELAAGVKARSVAFPCISTGVYAFPPERAAPIAVATVRAVLSAPHDFREIVFCCYSVGQAELYRALLGAGAA
jgi:O-acetyl-ADP-ribose deacetylase (regulator of RNase III)